MERCRNAKSVVAGELENMPSMKLQSGPAGVHVLADLALRAFATNLQPMIPKSL